MVGGELNTFLTMLLGSITQLGVAVSDLQASLLDENVQQPSRYRVQLAMALVAAARTLRGMATALQNNGSLQGAAEGETDPRPAPASQEAAPASQAGAAIILAEAEAQAESLRAAEGSESEAAGDNDPSQERLQWPSLPEDEVLEVFLDPIQEVFAVGQQPTGEMVVTGAASGIEGDLSPGQFHNIADVAQMMQQPWLAGLVAGPSVDTPAVAIASSDGGAGRLGTEGSAIASMVAARPSSDTLASMPPEIAECWNLWTQPESFRRVLTQAQQPAFSNAYASGDAVGSQRSTLQIPPAAEFLPLRWQRAAGRVEGLDELPEPPEHLARAYISAFLRDAGEFARGSATFQSIPEAEERFPHLSLYARQFGQRAPDTGAGPSGGSRPEVNTEPLQD
jgi:hypothetical protein